MSGISSAFSFQFLMMFETAPVEIPVSAEISDLEGR